MYKQVRTYKQIKNELFAWGQLIQIVSTFILVISFILFIFILLSLILNSFPFLLILSIDANTTPRFFPTSDDGTLFYGYFLHFVAIMMTV